MSDKHDCGDLGSNNNEERNKKKIKLNDDIFVQFKHLLREDPEIIAMLDLLKTERYALAPFELRSCNAADPNLGGVCFTKATCVMVPKPKKVAFANFFIEAFKMLKNFLKDDQIPEDKQKKMILSRLLKFLSDKDIQKPLCSLGDCSDETEFLVLSGFHLFSQLSTSPAFTIDSSKSNKIKWCPCGRRHGQAVYGDTSLGNPSVWHGHIDLIMEGADVPIESLDDWNDDSMYKNTLQLDDQSPGSHVTQIAAKTIVYSHFYRKLYPENTSSLIPCVGIGKNGLLFYFYDPDNDVMLGSTIFNLFDALKPKRINYTAIFALWMVLNHKHFSDGSSCANLPKAEFSKFAKNKIDVYKNELRRGDVYFRSEYSSLDPLRFNTSDFVLSEELDEI